MTEKDTSGAAFPQKPRIFVFSNVVGGGDGPALAMAEDGTVLGSHWCSHEGYANIDLGVKPGTRPDLHETYAKHYPNGYEMEFVPSHAIESHEKLKAAFDLNAKAALREVSK